jgi:hypothetical protein
MLVTLLYLASVIYHFLKSFVKLNLSWLFAEMCGSLIVFMWCLSSDVEFKKLRYVLTYCVATSICVLCVVAVITLDRFLVIIFPFRVRRLEMPKTRLLMALGWLGAAILSGLPLLHIDYFQ